MTGSGYPINLLNNGNCPFGSHYLFIGDWLTALVIDEDERMELLDDAQEILRRIMQPG